MSTPSSPDPASKRPAFVYIQKPVKNADQDLSNTSEGEPSATERGPKTLDLNPPPNPSGTDAGSPRRLVGELTVSPRTAGSILSESGAASPRTKPAVKLSLAEPEAPPQSPSMESASGLVGESPRRSPRSEEDKNSSHPRIRRKKTETKQSLQLALAGLNSANKSSTAVATTSATTTTTTTTTTSTRTTTAAAAVTTASPQADRTTTTMGSPRSASLTPSLPQSSLTDPKLPRPHWIPYFTGATLGGNTDIAERGKARRHEVEVLLRGAINSAHPEILFQEGNPNRPKLWLSEFFAVAAPIWEDVVNLLQARSTDTAVKFALENPEANLKHLEKVFSAALDTWIKGHGAEGFAASMPIAAKALVAELRHEVRLAQAAIIGFGGKPDQVCRTLVADLLLATLASATDAPQPLTGLFVNYMAAFLGREPDKRAGIQLGDHMLTSIAKWAAGQAVQYPASKFNPVEDMLHLDIHSPVHEVKFHCGSEDFNARVKFGMKQFQVWSVLFGMGSQEGAYDRRFSPPLQREFRGSSNWYRLESDGTRTDLSKDREALAAIFKSKLEESMPPELTSHGLMAQACCTQNFNQAALNMLVGEAQDQSPFFDMHGRQISPLFTTCHSTWTIARSEVDGSFSIHCEGYFYLENVELAASNKDRMQREKPRLLAPGWLRLELAVSISERCTMQVTNLVATAYNLHLLEAPVVKDEHEPKPGSGPMKSLRKLSQRVLPLHTLTSAETDTAVKSPRSSSRSESAPEMPSPSSGSLKGKLQKEKTKKN